MSHKLQFIAHDTAPNAEEAYSGTYVPNKVGGNALRAVLRSTRDTDQAILDITTEPPTLRLNDAPVNLVDGSLVDDGTFAPYGDRGSVWFYTATGNYQGPGSELELQSDHSRS